MRNGILETWCYYVVLAGSPPIILCLRRIMRQEEIYDVSPKVVICETHHASAQEEK
jgi:hypothetical protein